MLGRLSLTTSCLVALLLASVAQATDALPGGRAIVVTTSVTPDTHLFADPIAARVDIVVDSEQLDPDRIRVNLAFAPYTPIGGVKQTRLAIGKLVRIRYAVSLRCLEIKCFAPRFRTALGDQESGRPDRYLIRFQPAAILYESTQRETELLFERPFAPVEVVSRLNTGQAEEAQLEQALMAYRASVEAPPMTYRVPPKLLAAVALAGALLLLCLPAAIAVRFVYARWRSARRPRPLSPLDRALVLIRWSVRRDDGVEDRRKALEALAAVAEHDGVHPLAQATRALAWDEPAPRREQAEEIASQAAATLGRGVNGRQA